MAIRPHYVIVGVILAVVAILYFTASPSSAEDCPLVNPPGPNNDVARCTDPKNGRDADIDKALAIGAASSLPVWLGDKETFAVSGGLGFTEGETAVGATAIVRVEKNISAFAGGAISTEDTDAWAGKVGGRIGF